MERLARPVERQPLTFLNLPNEVLIEISTHLDCDGLLLMRTCCKALYSVTKSLQLWREIARTLCKDYNLAPPERGAEAYTAEELEYWCLKRAFTQDVWNKRRHAQSRAHIAKICYAPLPRERSTLFSYFLSGRWMLLTVHPGLAHMMYVIDLDSSSLGSQVLFDNPEWVRDRRHLTYAYWNDHSNPRLLYRMAVTVNFQHTRQTWVYNVEPNDDTPSSHLVATPHVKFWGPSWIPIMTAVNKSYLVEVHKDLEGNKAISVYPYDDACRHGQCPHLEPDVQCPLLESTSIALQFLKFIYDDVFATWTESSVLRVFDIVRRDPNAPKPSYSVDLLHKIPFSFPDYVQWTPGFSRVVTVWETGNVQGLRIPHNRREDPFIIDLGKHDKTAPECVLCTSTSVKTYCCDKPFCIVAHGSSANPDPRFRFCVSKVCAQVPELTRPKQPLGFCKDIGRLVFLKDQEWRDLVVIDLVPADAT